MINRILNTQTKTIGGATGILAVSSIISGILGLLTDRLLAGNFGAGLETSIYFAAFKIPDLVYNILISGGVLVAFLPLFAEYFSESKEKAWEMTNHILNVFFFLLLVLSTLLFILTPQLTEFVTPGFAPQEKLKVVLLARILLLQPILLGLANIFSGVLHYFNRFLSYGLAPILYNAGIISGILLLSPRFGILGAGFGVIAGAFLHLLIQLISGINCGFKYRPFFNFKYPAVKKIFALMLPRIFALSAHQINFIFITAFASTISAGSIAIFNFAQALQNLPIAILGISLATAVFPVFSKLWVNGQKKEFVDKFSSIFKQALFLLIPMSVALILLRAQIVRIVLGAGKFGWDDTRLTAASLGLFAISVFASATIPILFRIFFSLKDTKTPTILTFIAVAGNIGLSVVLVRLLSVPGEFLNFAANALRLDGINNLAVIGLPLSLSLTTIAELMLALLFLYRKIGDFNARSIALLSGKAVFGAILMGFAIYFSLKFLANAVDMRTFAGVLSQTVIAGIFGFAVYFFVSKILKIDELGFFLRRLRNLI